MTLNVSPLLEEMKFLFLRDFAVWAEERIADDWTKLDQKAEDGNLAEYEDYETAMDPLLFRAKYAAESTLHLLNALVDEQLRHLAESVVECRHGPKKSTPPWERVAQLRFKELILLIESEYGIKLPEIDGWDDYLRIREIVNTLKHNSGRRKLKNVVAEGGTLADMEHRFNLEAVKRDIESCLSLVRQLFSIAALHGKSAR